MEGHQGVRAEEALLVVVQADGQDHRWLAALRSQLEGAVVEAGGAGFEHLHVGLVVTVALREERRVGALGHGGGEGVEAAAVGHSTSGFVVVAPGVHLAVDRYRADGAHQAAEDRDLEQAVAGAEDDAARKAGHDQPRVDEGVGVPGDHQAATAGGYVPPAGDPHLAKEDADEAAEDEVEQPVRPGQGFRRQGRGSRGRSGGNFASLDGGTLCPPSAQRQGSSPRLARGRLEIYRI